MEKDLTMFDIIDKGALLELMDAFSMATGMPVLAADLNGPATSYCNPHEYCIKYSDESKANERDAEGFNLAKKFGKPAIFKCADGMTDFIVPVTLNNRQLGYLMGGMAFEEKPEYNKLAKAVKGTEIDPAEYFEALKTAAIIPADRLQSAANMLFIAVNALVQTGYSKILSVSDNDSYNDAAKNEIYINDADTDAKISAVASSVKDFADEFEKIREKTNESAKIVEQTDSIIKYIQNVATQMTLLGFNASIEAKHVGEAGAGFNVIAQEVRQLAEQTSNQTRNVEDVLNNVKSSIKSIEQELQIAVEKVKANVDEVNALKR